MARDKDIIDYINFNPWGMKPFQFNPSATTFLQKDQSESTNQDMMREYDARMKVWKKAVVDAKHGGLPPWEQTKRLIVDNVFGKGTAEKVFGVFNKETRRWEKPKSSDYANVQNLYSHVFGRNYAEGGRAWSPDEMQSAVNEYFKDSKNPNQLEHIVSHIPKLDLSIFPDLDINKLAKFYKDYNLSAGALGTNKELFRKLVADPNYVPDETEQQKFFLNHKVKDFNPTPENIKSAFTDFIMNDINTVVTRRYIPLLPSASDHSSRSTG